MNQSSLDPWQRLEEEYPEIAQCISDAIDKLFDLTALDEKIRQLVYIAAQTAVNCSLAVKYHVPLALDAGASRDEIVGAAAIAATAGGPKGFVRSFPAILEAIEEYKKEV